VYFMSGAARRRAHDAFTRHFGGEPDGIAFAPGRVNLIGDHVDYSDGLVLPVPLALGTAIAWRVDRRDAGQVGKNAIRALAADFADAECDILPGEACGATGDWRSYLGGMVDILKVDRANGRAAELAIAGDLPRGAGLSSSASFCVAIGRALTDAGLAQPLSPVELAQAAQRAEHEYAGVACGIMDQIAAACGQPGHAMLLDCRTHAWRDLALPAGWAVMVVPSGVTRGLVDGEYNLRRSQCEAAARLLGAASLRDVSAADLAAASLPQAAAMRARHVVEEIARVAEAGECLARADLAGFGDCLSRSHWSLRDLFEVSHPDVDRLVAVLQTAIGKSGGARMTGGGFGGAVVAVVGAGEVDRIRRAVASHYSPLSAASTLVVAAQDPQFLPDSTKIERKIRP